MTPFWVNRLGWTLLHFLWQGTLIAILYAIARRFLQRTKSPQPLYLLACVAMGAMLVAVAATYVGLGNQPAAVAIRVPAVAIHTAPFVQSPETQPFESVPTSVMPAWRETAMPLLVALWFAGAAILSLRLLFGWTTAVRLRSVFTRPAPREWQLRLDSLRSQFRVARPVKLCVSAAVQVPIVLGALRPVILIPAGAITGLPPEWIDALLAHELAHVSRYDYLVNIAQKVCEALLFYHPAVWWISGHIREEREHCCDDVAVRIPGDAILYARTLATLERERATPLTFALAANGGVLRPRIARLLGQTDPRPRDFPGSSFIAGIILMSFAAAGLWAQAGPRFDAATVKANHSGTGVDHIQIGGGSVTLQNVSLKRLIGMAHGVQEGRSYLFSGPDWLDFENFDVLAKYPADTPNAQVLQMLQRELEERFSLRLHRETKEFSAYALVLTKGGPKFHATARPGGAHRFSMQNGHAVGSAITMGMFGDRLSRPDFGLDRPVVDQTGLTGAYDVTFDWKPGEPDTPSASLFTAIQEQLGLRIEARKIPLEVLVVDHSERVPKEN